MHVTSSSFADGGAIPVQYTCEGDDVSPPIAWNDVPDGTRTLALVVDDPDAPDPAAPKRVWVHWVVVDLDPTHGRIDERGSTRLPAGARNGTNDWGAAAWGGPCPPIGRHRYVFTLYALDIALPRLRAPTKRELEAAMQGHVLARAELVGTYEKRAAPGITGT